MPSPSRNRLLALLWLLLLPAPAGSASNLDPSAFDKDGDLHLNEEELVDYIIRRDELKPDWESFLTPDLKLKPDAQRRIDENLRGQAAFRAGAIYAKVGRPAGTPIPLGLLQGSPPPGSARDRVVKVPGVFGEPLKSGSRSLGPLLLRRDKDGWDDDLANARGAKVSYADNRRTGKASWSSEGALIYPVLSGQESEPGSSGARIRSERWRLLPSASWKVVKFGAVDKGEVEELSGQMAAVWSANHAELGWLRNSRLTLTPYFLTDFSLEGRVWGVTADYAPYIFDNSGSLGINTGYKGLWTLPLLYRFDLVPSLDFNHLAHSSRFIDRAGDDDYLRTGGRTELGLATMGYPSLEFVLSYRAFAGIRGAPGYSDLSSLASKFWLNRHAGLAVEYERGSTPIAQRDIDLWTLSFELKF